MSNPITADTITDRQIRALMNEAIEANDAKQADLCRLALGMTPIRAWNLTPYAARIRCARAIAAAAASQAVRQ